MSIDNHMRSVAYLFVLKTLCAVVAWCGFCYKEKEKQLQHTFGKKGDSLIIEIAGTGPDAPGTFEQCLEAPKSSLTQLFILYRK